MRGAAILLACLLLLAPAARADRQTAEFFSGRGDKSLAAKEWPQAEEHYREALEADGTFLPARYGLAQALIGKGSPVEAVDELKTFLAAMREQPSAPAEWKTLAARAEKQLGEMDAAAVALQKIVDRYADELVLLARRCAAKDPVTAQRAAERALLLRPGDKQAAEILARVGEVAKGPPVDLFSGTDVSKWDQLEFPHWQVLGGNIVGDVRSGSRVIRTVESFKGDYDLRVEARIVEERAGTDFLVLAIVGFKGENDYLGVGLINRKVYFTERSTEEDRRILRKTPIADWKAPYDPTQFAVYELQVRESTITSLINGTVVGEEPRSDRRRDGFVALMVQNGTVAFRKIEVQRR